MLTTSAAVGEVVAVVEATVDATTAGAGPLDDTAAASVVGAGSVVAAATAATAAMRWAVVGGAAGAVLAGGAVTGGEVTGGEVTGGDVDGGEVTVVFEPVIDPSDGVTGGAPAGAAVVGAA